MELIRAKKPQLSIDLAPLIDVVFQLLVFFMLTSAFANPAMRLNLPQANSGELTKDEQIIVSVDKSGELAINDTRTNVNAFQTDLARLLQPLSVKSISIRGDENMPYKYFVQIMDLSRQAGAQQINIIYQEPK
jgi:biopolymer transport protein ExbD